MVRRYRGKGSVSRHLASLRGNPSFFIIRIEPYRVHFFTKVMEAHSHMALIIPVNTGDGLVAVYATPETMPEVKIIVNNFPYPVEIME